MGDRNGNGSGDGRLAQPYPWLRGLANCGGAGNGNNRGDGSTYEPENDEPGDYWTIPIKQGFGSWS